ncbi:hypothetical protein sphantq_00659 [Sphingobium sp. AntQ-1]|nr:hypothetical protein sphantq_00659 [Sphingobium sp. AntQ-1]
MPDFTVYPFDRPASMPDPMPPREAGTIGGEIVLPSSGWAAVLRGARNRCPRCQQAKLFARFLKPVPHCPACGQNWTHQRADDFPAYVSILLTGHLMAPIIITLVRDFDLSTAALVAIIMPLAMILMIGLLQPAKGAIIALQWWLGMHGFERERPVPPGGEAVP